MEVPKCPRVHAVCAETIGKKKHCFKILAIILAGKEKTWEEICNHAIDKKNFQDWTPGGYSLKDLLELNHASSHGLSDARLSTHAGSFKGSSRILMVESTGRIEISTKRYGPH